MTPYPSLTMKITYRKRGGQGVVAEETFYSVALDAQRGLLWWIGESDPTLVTSSDACNLFGSSNVIQPVVHITPR